MFAEINKDTIFVYLKAFAKAISKQYRHIDLDFYIVGGASMVLLPNAGESTMDIDILKQRTVDIKDVAVSVGEMYNLPKDWINDDVMYTSSFSSKLCKYVDFTKTFSNTVHFHFIKDVALCAMKLKAARMGTNDANDIAFLRTRVSDKDVIACYKDLYNEEIDLDKFQLNTLSFQQWCALYAPPGYVNWSAENVESLLRPMYDMYLQENM